jgi:uncharacterized protein (DUF4415 family)
MEGLTMARRPADLREAAKAAGSAKPAPLLPKPTSLPHARELVSLRIDHQVLDYFQEDGPLWQQPINAAGK